jgi:hypothetical protein
MSTRSDIEYDYSDLNRKDQYGRKLLGMDKYGCYIYEELRPFELYDRKLAEEKKEEEAVCKLRDEEDEMRINPFLLWSIIAVISFIAFVLISAN